MSILIPSNRNNLSVEINGEKFKMIISFIYQKVVVRVLHQTNINSEFSIFSLEIFLDKKLSSSATALLCFREAFNKKKNRKCGFSPLRS